MIRGGELPDNQRQEKEVRHSRVSKTLASAKTLPNHKVGINQLANPVFKKEEIYHDISATRECLY